LVLVGMVILPECMDQETTSQSALQRLVPAVARKVILATALPGLLLWVLWLGCPAMAAEVAGTVSRISGEAFGTTDGGRSPVAAGSPVYRDEILETGVGARLAVTLADGTSITLGERATLVLDRFVYDPNGATDLHAAVSGAFRFISGKLQANATRSASIATDAATIGIRGTDFWGGPIDGGLGFVLLDGGIDVTAAGQTLSVDASGAGVSVDDAGLGPVVPWPDEKIARAIATVTFP
jgi:hypothetical protein